MERKEGDLRKGAKEREVWRGKEEGGKRKEGKEREGEGEEGEREERRKKLFFCKDESRRCAQKKQNV